MAIDIGAGAADYGAAGVWSAYTFLDKTNPANASGTLDTFEIYFAALGVNGTEVKIGTFSGSGTDWDDRDYESIGGVAKGSKQTFSGKNCDVVTNDIIGIYFAVGNIEANYSGGSGYLFVSGDKFGAGSSSYFLADADGKLALYATGTEASGAWTHITKVNGVASANIAKVNGIAVANIAKVNNVAV